jgi:cysteine desulfurase / selenocysteine lyase
MIYLDNAATSHPKPESVYQALDQFAREHMANPGRAGHKMALASERMLEDTRHLINQFFHGEAPERFIFTLNTTDALNMAFKGTLSEGDHVITTDLEHNSVSRPLRALEMAGHISLTRIRADGGGTVDPGAIQRAISPQTRLIAITHASNVLGTVQPIPEIGRVAREHDLVFLVDAAQTAGVLPIDVQAMYIDLLAFPGHKALYGPTGTGCLYVGPRLSLRAWREGGTGGDSSSETQPRELPHFLEGGTPNVLGIAGLAAGVRYVQDRGTEPIRSHEVSLLERLQTGLKEIEGVLTHGHANWNQHVAAFSFSSRLIPASELAAVLDQALHCAPYAHRSLGTFPEGTVRISPGAFTSAEDIDQLLNALGEILAS